MVVADDSVSVSVYAVAIYADTFTAKARKMQTTRVNADEEDDGREFIHFLNNNFYFVPQ